MKNQYVCLSNFLQATIELRLKDVRIIMQLLKNTADKYIYIIFPDHYQNSPTDQVSGNPACKSDAMSTTDSARLV